MIDNITTRVLEQDSIDNIFEELAQGDSPQKPPTVGKSVVLVAPGEYKDPRQTFTGTLDEDFGEITNSVGKLQRSVRVILPDGSSILVSAFGPKTAELKNLKLGWTYTFTGKLKTKKEVFRGKERTS